MSERLGEYLSRQLPLTPLDIEEILTEQGQSRKPFGELALELGPCTPEHVWRAWLAQLEGEPRRVDLQRVGVDAQAVAALPPDIAIELGVLPIRLIDGVLVVVTTPDRFELARRHLPSRLGYRVQLALADAGDIARTIEVCYLPLLSGC